MLALLLHGSPPHTHTHLPASVMSAVGLLAFGYLGARLGGANVVRGALRVVLGGWMALGVVYGIGRALQVDSAGR